MQAHRSELIEESNFQDADLIVVMSADQARVYRARFTAANYVVVLGDLDPQPIDRRTILDPWNQGSEVFDDCYTRLDRCVRRLAELVDGPARRSGR